MHYWKTLLVPGVAAAAVLKRDSPDYDKLADCPGYAASNVKTTGNGLTAELKLAGPACNTYGTDLEDLTLSVTYESEARIHVKIQEPADQVYQVPESVFPRPDEGSFWGDAKIKFDYTEEPFAFTIKRSDTDEVLFDTSAASIVFESQYLRLRTSLPEDPYLYGLQDVTDIPLLIRSGKILPLRVASANTTTALRQNNFELLVTLDVDGQASGALYLDDGVSLVQQGHTLIDFTFENGVLSLDGTFGYEVDVKIVKVKVLGASCRTGASKEGRGSKTVKVDLSLNKAGSVKVW
ncbi:hypothetical protein BN1723_001885 [Verticillium longisporum]|uniref:Uncharacterized protein n=1 Tax=Verticillium longisporum TaxID=100787 RepID=A0A0G4KSJ5_VERLO|nr:hypothetical protein BN1723_001885 [Verticillium longisporum]